MPKTSSGTSAAGGGAAAASEKLHTEQDALTSMRFASRMCFVAVAYDVLLAILDDYSVWWSDEPFTWVEYVDVFDSLNWLVFGVGLLRATELYGQTLHTLRRDDRVQMGTVRDLCRIMSRIWRTTSWALVGVSASLAATLQEHAGSSVSGDSSSKTRMIGAPVALLAVAALGSVGVRRWSAQNASKAITAAKKKEEEDVKPFSDEAAETRSMGLRNCVSMNLCMASYTLLGLMQLATWIVMPASVVGRISTVFNFLTPFTICGLLLTLSKSFLRTLIAITGGGSPSKHVHGGNMFEAQTEFFTKIGNTLRSKVVFGLLPFVYAAAVKGFHILVG